MYSDFIIHNFTKIRVKSSAHGQDVPTVVIRDPSRNTYSSDAQMVLMFTKAENARRLRDALSEWLGGLKVREIEAERERATREAPKMLPVQRDVA